MKYYKAYYSTWSTIDAITEVEVERETDQSVFIKGRRAAITTEREAYRKTFDHAKQWLISKAQIDLDQAEERVSAMRMIYRAFKELSETKENV